MSLITSFSDNLIDSLNKNRPSWDQYFLLLARVMATRSRDPSTKHGCIIVNSISKRILSTGYNGGIQGVDDNKIPLTRPAKYFYMIHAEENALLFAPTNIANSLVYITGFPCSKCFRMLAQKKINKVICGSQTSHMINKEDAEATMRMSELTEIAIQEIEESALG